MWVKICGTTHIEDARLAVAYGADALGFIFAPSKRRVTVAEAAAIHRQLPPGVERVGVFTQATPDEIVAAVTGASLTAGQLHRPHEPEHTAELTRLLGPEIKLIQVIAVEAEQSIAGVPSTHLIHALRRALTDPSLWAILLDSSKGGNSGGLGLTFPWGAAARALNEARASSQQPGTDPLTPEFSGDRPRLLLAGGLHAGNLPEAVAALQPWGVDCVSGVEARPGRKDPDRLRSFLAAAHAGR